MTPRTDTTARQHFLKRRDRVILLVILLAALCLRLWGLAAKSLWLDEILTVENTMKPYSTTLRSYGEMIGHLKKFEAHPPAYQSLIWLWLHAGRGDEFARFPSVVAGCISVWLSYLIARRLLGRRAAAVTALLMAVSAFQIYFSQEARLFALLNALFLGQFYVMVRILHQRGRPHWGWWAGYGVLIAACLFTYVLSILPIGAFGLLYFWFRRRRGIQWAPLVITHLIVAILFAATWYPHLHRRAEQLRKSIATHQDAAGRPTPGQLASGVAAWGFGPMGWDRMDALGPVCGVGLLVAAGLALATRRTKRPGLMLGTLFVVSMAGYLLMPMPRVQAYEAKHLIFLQPVLLMALAGAHGKVGSPSPRRRGPACAVRHPERSEGSFGGKDAGSAERFFAGAQNDTAAQGHPGAAQTLRQRVLPLFYAAFAVVAVNAFVLGTYYSPNCEKENWSGLFQYVDDRLDPTDAFVFDPEYIGFTMSHYAKTPEGKQGVLLLTQRGRRMSERVPRVWLIQCKSRVARPTDRARTALSEAGWTQEDHVRYEGILGYVQATLFSRPSGLKGTKP